MANAKKCDRCKNYYDENTKHKTKGRVKGSVITGFSTTSKFNVGHDEMFDLCDDCITKLFEFLENKR